jgi:hypothetical protein
MIQRIPLDFPKVWPYNEEYRDHVAKAVRLKSDTSLLFVFGLLLITLGIVGTFVFGSFHVYSLSRFFFSMIPIGIVLAVIGNSLHKKKLEKIMSEVKSQVDLEKTYLKKKSLAPLFFDSHDDLINKEVMELSNGRHYTNNWAWVRNKLLIRDGSSCCFCGRSVHLADSVAHHISAFSEGGRTDFSNLVTICVQCHSIIHPWLNPNLNLFWVRYERGGRVYCWKCKKRLDSLGAQITICSDCGWLHHIDDGACGCNYRR